MRLKSVLLFLLFPGLLAAQNTNFDQKLPAVDRYIDSLMKKWNIPGLALAIVHKDQLIYAKGYGYRDLRERLPVTPATLFPIASNTKLFTATAACILAEEGKFSLDEPVKHFFPELRFSNEELNARVTLRDMLSHRTGLPRYDGIWIGASFTRKEIVQKISQMKPVWGFREGYIYNNMMFVGAGAALESVTGKSWESLIREKLFTPLQMSSSCFTDAETERYGNYALSYFLSDSNGLQPRTFTAQCEALGPAGTIRSNLQDMSHWMVAQLNGGMYRGLPVFSTNVLQQTLMPNSISDREGRYGELSNALYGLGRNISMYKGFKIASHTGSIDGFYSNLTFIPNAQLAVFMVHNSTTGALLRNYMTLPVIDLLLQSGYTNWSERCYANYLTEKRQEKAERDSIQGSRVPGTQPSHVSLAEYTGSYESPLYGSIRISLELHQLRMAFRGQRSLLEHFHYDLFETRETNTDLPNYRLQFHTNAGGGIDRITTRIGGDPAAEFIKKSPQP